MQKIILSVKNSNYQVFALERAEATGKDLRDELQRIAQDLADPQSDWPTGKVRW